MSYLNAYLEPCPGYGWQGGPTFNTQVVTLANGRERRNANWSRAQHTYTAPYNNITIQAYRNIKRMHLVCRGQLHCFRFRDALDHEADDEAFGDGDGATTEFQLKKISAVDGVEYEREVYAIVSATITVDGEAAAYEVDMDRGIVTFATAPANGAVLRWSGVFDVWVRFNQDDLPFTIDNPNVVNGSVTLLEMLPPPAES